MIEEPVLPNGREVVAAQSASHAPRLVVEVAWRHLPNAETDLAQAFLLRVLRAIHGLLECPAPVLLSFLLVLNLQPHIDVRAGLGVAVLPRHVYVQDAHRLIQRNPSQEVLQGFD